MTNGDEPMDQDLSVVPTKCISSVENLEIRSVIILLVLCRKCSPLAHKTPVRVDQWPTVRYGVALCWMASKYE